MEAWGEQPWLPLPSPIAQPRERPHTPPTSASCCPTGPGAHMGTQFTPRSTSQGRDPHWTWEVSPRPFGRGIAGSRVPAPGLERGSSSLDGLSSFPADSRPGERQEEDQGGVLWWGPGCSLFPWSEDGVKSSPTSPARQSAQFCRGKDPRAIRESETHRPKAKAADKGPEGTRLRV